MTYNRPKITYTLNLIVFYLTSMVLVGCGTNKDIPLSKQTTDLKQTPKIVFINYAIKKDANGNKKVEFRSSKQVEGKLKNQKKILDTKGDSGDLICSQFDASSSILSQKLIENPLKKNIEYVDEHKNFKMASIELDSAEFTVRLQLYPETVYIAINSTVAPQRPLILTKVSEL